MKSCRFCDIGAGERDAHIVGQNELAVAFLDREPAVLGHTLVIPRTHAHGIDTLKTDEVVAVFQLTGHIAQALTGELDADGVSAFHTSGPLIGSIDHAHVHLIPRYRDDDIHISLSRAHLDEEDAREVQAAIIEGVNDSSSPG